MVQGRKADKGFALIAALLAVWILTALGMLVFSVTTQDVRVSSRAVGERKAFSAAESGIHWLTQNFDPANPTYAVVSNVAVDSNTDAYTQYTITAPTSPTMGPAALQYPGFSMGGGEIWGQTRHLVSVTGTNTKYNSNVRIDVGIGYGPVDITTIYR